MMLVHIRFPFSGFVTFLSVNTCFQVLKNLILNGMFAKAKHVEKYEMQVAMDFRDR